MTDRHPSSFRDPSGFIYRKDSVLYRQVNEQYATYYDALMGSGLYGELLKDGLIIAHEEVEVEPPFSEAPVAYKTLRPEPVPFISYPYEWCFSELKDAALATLEIQKKAVDHGMTLKDASAYNIQFVSGKPILIDTLSFESLKEGEPWVAYRQFSQHFLAPLALMSYTDVRLAKLLSVFIDGIPLDLASSLLPGKSKFAFSLMAHIHLQKKSQKHFESKAVKKEKVKVSRTGLLGIIDSLEGAVKKLEWKPGGTEWGDYYEDTNYSEAAHEHKKKLAGEFIETVKPASVCDLGGNTGLFSRIASDRGIPTVSTDIDPAAVEKNYLEMKAKGETDILPLVLDLTNPSQALGWAGSERESFSERGPFDMAFAFALIHHIAISNNVPLSSVAEYFSLLARHLIIEFVPKSDSQVKRLLATREDVFPGYTKEGFEREFLASYRILRSESIADSERTLYLMEAVSA